jgi:hypothetical protein
MPKEIDVYSRQTMAFRRKFGREMGPEDPFFFDPEADTPCFRDLGSAGDVLAELGELLKQAGAEPAHLYAFHRTGGLLPPGTAEMTALELAEWEAAVAEYYRSLQ